MRDEHNLNNIASKKRASILQFALNLTTPYKKSKKKSRNKTLIRLFSLLPPANSKLILILDLTTLGFFLNIQKFKTVNPEIQFNISPFFKNC